MNQTRSWRTRLTPVQWVGLAAAVVILPCCGGAALIGAFSGDPEPAASPTPGAAAAVAERLAGAPDATTGAATPGETAAAAVVEKTVTVRKSIGYETRTVDDDNLAQGKTKVRTAGVAGVRTLTYRVTLTGGKETARELVSDVVTKKPVTKVVAIGTKTPVPPSGGCDPNYDPCVPIASDVDCKGGSGNGPAYVAGPVKVIGEDPYDLDRDGDGIACD